MIGRIFLGRYQATRLLGEGGMGRVYLGRQLDLGRQVVVKVMHDHIAADPRFRERFQRETLLMARFQHPYAVTLYDARLDDPEGPCIIMEYIRGVSLDELLIKNGRLSPARVGRLLEQLCEALQAAHAEGIIHRDLKPANLMVVDPDTPYEKIKVMDFGLAKLAERTALPQSNTASNAEFAVGTPGYMCPEQVRGEEVDHRGDLYSVGVILYELLTARLPFAGKSSIDVLIAHANEEPPSFAKTGADAWLSSAIEEVVMACLAKNPNDRPSNARELAERFEQALEDEQADQQRRIAGESSLSEPDRAAAPVAVEDPGAVVRVLEAWMPERIAAYKLHGFVQDLGGEVMESVPGRIRVLLGGSGSAFVSPSRGPFGWLLRRRSGPVELDLHLEQADSRRDNLLQVTVSMRSAKGDLSLDPEWRARCDQIYCDLRGYLMGKSGDGDG